MRFRRDRSGDKIEVQMAPMVDIVFLLLVFFMVTASFIVEESELKISLPATVTTESPKEELPDEVIIYIMSDGGIAVNEMEYDSPDSEELPELRTMLSRLASIFTDQNVIIQADGTVSHGRVVDVLNACVASDVTNISFYMP